MKRDGAIDDIFKTGLQEKAFNNKDALWQRIETGLDKQGRRRRLVLFIVLFFGIATVGTFLLIDKNKNTTPLSINENTNSRQPEIFTAPPNTTTALENILINKNYVQQQLPIKHSSTLYINKKIKGIHSNETTEATAPQKNEEVLVEELEKINLKNLFFNPEIIKPNSIDHYVLPALKNYTPANKKPDAVQKKKYNIEILGGTDITNIKKPAGYYAGASFYKPLKNGAGIAAAVLYSVNKVQESYRLSNKPSYNRETDATVDNLSMLQCRIQFRQQIKHSRFSVAAGLTLVYILSAAIDNVPHADSVYPGSYRRFTLQDINRLNVLFTAGAGYLLLHRLTAEINGSYGLTELVKNSYINQSNVKSNFKKLQLGLIYKLK